MRWSSESCGRLRATCQIARADDLRGEVLVDGSAAFRLPGGVGERCGGGTQLFAEPLHGRVALAARMPEHLNVEAVDGKRRIEDDDAATVADGARDPRPVSYTHLTLPTSDL